MARQLNTAVNTDLITRFITEGRPMADYESSVFNEPKGTITAGNNQNVGSPFQPLDSGRAFYCTSLTVTADDQCEVFGVISSDNGTRTGVEEFRTSYAAQFGSSGGQVTIPVNELFRENSFINCQYRSNQTNEVNVSIKANGYDITNDLNFTADKMVMIAGDSISWTSMGNDASGDKLLGKNLYAFRLVEQLKKDGLSSRLVNKGFGGSKSIHASYYVDTGYYDVNYDLLLVGYGTNDAVDGAVSETDFKASLNNFINHRDANRPNADIVFIDPPVTDTANRTPYLPDIRTWISEVVAAAGSNVYEYDASTAFSLDADATSDPNFNRSELSAGSRLHPNENGHDLIYQGLYSVVQTTDFYTDNT